MRRGDPERICQAQRAGTFRRLVEAERFSELDAEHWIARWEREAEARGRGRWQGFWDDGWHWIAEQRRKPPDATARLSDRSRARPPAGAGAEAA